MKKTVTRITPLALSLALFLPACTDTNSSSGSHAGHGHDHGSDTHEHGEDHSHTHADGSTHADHAQDDHDETPLEPITIGDMTIELAQGHGSIAPNKEGHLVVKLPYSDDGATVVRAWIGTDDRTLSFVGMGEYTASSNQYDIHAIAPETLSDDTMWWIELEKTDGSKLIGSAKPIM